MLVQRLFEPWPTHEPLPKEAKFLDDTRCVIGFPSYGDLHPEDHSAKFHPSGSGGMNPGWRDGSSKVHGVMTEYDPRLSVREFGRYVPYEPGYGVRRYFEPRNPMRRFEVDDDFVNGNSSQRQYNKQAIQNLNNRATHFDVPARGYAKAAMVRNPHRSQTHGLTPEESRLLRQHITDGVSSRPRDLQTFETGLPAPRNALAPAAHELGPLHCFETAMPLSPAAHTAGVVGHDEEPFSRFEQGGDGLYALGTQFLCEQRQAHSVVALDSNLKERKALRDHLAQLKAEQVHLTRVRDGHLIHAREVNQVKKQEIRPVQPSAEALGLEPNFEFSQRVYQCEIEGNGVAYRHTPDFADKNHNGAGPKAPQVIVVNDICQGPHSVFVKCASGLGWLPLAAPNGKRMFKHLGTVEEVGDLDVKGLVLAH